MLGSDPIAAILGAAIDPRSSATVWKAYLRALVKAGAAVTMLAPDVVTPVDASDEVLQAITALRELYPPGSQMSKEEKGALGDAGVVDRDGSRVNNRVSAYFRHIHKAVGKDLAPELLARGVVTPSAAIHVGVSDMVAVNVPDAAALEAWRSWAAEISGDPRERHTVPTILLPTNPGGGIYLFRTDGDTLPAELHIDKGFEVRTGDFLVQIPPTRVGGKPTMRLGPARMLPEWLRSELSPRPRLTAVR